jgi:hypothetical protein
VSPFLIADLRFVVYLSSVISQCGDLLLAVWLRTSSSQTMSAYRIIEGPNIANPRHITHSIDRESSPSKKAVLTTAHPLQRRFQKAPYSITETCICILAAI